MRRGTARTGTYQLSCTVYRTLSARLMIYRSVRSPPVPYPQNGGSRYIKLPVEENESPLVFRRVPDVRPRSIAYQLSPPHLPLHVRYTLKASGPSTRGRPHTPNMHRNAIPQEQIARSRMDDQLRRRRDSRSAHNVLAGPTIWPTALTI